MKTSSRQPKELARIFLLLGQFWENFLADEHRRGGTPIVPPASINERLVADSEQGFCKVPFYLTRVLS